MRWPRILRARVTDPAALRRRRTLVAMLAGLGLTACGGGISLGLGFGDVFDDLAPSVSIAASAETVRPGQSVRLVAAAADENGIDSVSFFQLDRGTPVLLGSDLEAPYEWTLIAPSGAGTVVVFARAVDRAGHWSDSATLAIVVAP